LQKPRIVAEQFDDGPQPLRQRIAHIGKRFEHVDVMTGGSEQIRDSVAHQATAHDADFLFSLFVHGLLDQINCRNCRHAETLIGQRSGDPTRRGGKGHACPALGRFLVVADGDCCLLR
jgi:hypothetical protein